MSATKRFHTFFQGKDIRDSQSNDAVHVEYHTVNLSERTTIETDLDKLGGALATPTNSAGTAVTRIDLATLSAPDATTGKRTVTITGGAGQQSIMLWGWYEGE